MVKQEKSKLKTVGNLRYKNNNGANHCFDTNTKIPSSIKNDTMVRNKGNRFSILLVIVVIITIITTIFVQFSRVDFVKPEIPDSSYGLPEEQVTRTNDRPDHSLNSALVSRGEIGNGSGNISMAFFFDPNCPCSIEAMDELEKINASFTNIQQFWYDISVYESRVKWIRFMSAYNVPGTIKDDTPFLFIGDYYLYGEGVTLDNTSTIIGKYSDEDVPLWPAWQPKVSIHVAFFYNPIISESSPITTILQLLNDTWNKENEEFQLLFIFNFSLEKSRNGLLFEAYFKEFNLSRDTEYSDRSQIFAGVFIGDDFFLNSNITFNDLNSTITKYLGQNVPLKDITIDVLGGKICVLFFYSPYCHECAKARKILEDMKGKYPELDIHKYPTDDPETEILKQTYFEHYKVPTISRGTLGVFIGDKYFVDVNSLKSGLESQIKRYENGVSCSDLEPDKKVVVDTFNSFTVLAILGAGLVDSINPCAIATLIFFIGYLSRTERSKKEILTIGIAYTLGVFISYMALGLGLYYLISSSNEIQLFSQWLYPVMGAIVFIFGFYSLHDFNKARKGKKEEMKLQLPKPIKSLIGRVIKHQIKLKYFALIAIITGVLISLLEFLCTGQVYLPIITLAATIPELQSQAVLYLFLYNLMFVLPLVIIFVGVYKGMYAESLQGFLDKNRAMIKLMTAIVFFILGIFLIWYAWSFLF
jgi:cytochrome c biogenesis protein CcdA/glutaredoxin-related protein